MTTIADVRSQYPQYGDMSDDQLASALHSKFYADMPEADFRQKIGLQPPPEKPQMSTLQSAEQTAIGAGKELKAQVGGVAQMINAGPAILLAHPQETKKAVVEGAKSVGQAIAHPIDTARGALTDWMEKALPTPKTPAQAQERGAALVRG